MIDSRATATRMVGKIVKWIAGSPHLGAKYGNWPIG